jgi:hypothetical protein
MLCESCHKAEATCRICTIVDGISQSRDLCNECDEASSPEARAFAAAQREARCEYCGDQPCGGGTDFFAMITGEQKLKFMCMPCSMEHNRYLRQQLQRVSSKLPHHEQMSSIRQINHDADTHMKQWVLDRGSK